MFKDEQWVSYEDEQSVREKVKYANKQGFGGVAFNNLAYDDFEGRCNTSNKFPLLRMATANLRKLDLQKGSTNVITPSTVCCFIKEKIVTENPLATYYFGDYVVSMNLVMKTCAFCCLKKIE